MLMRGGEVLRGNGLIWLHVARQQEEAAYRLRRMYAARRSGPDRDAIWEGMNHCEQDRDRCVEEARTRGLLLHVGRAVVVRRYAQDAAEGGNDASFSVAPAPDARYAAKYNAKGVQHA